MKYMKSKDADLRVHSSRSAFALAQIVQGFRYLSVLATLSDSTSGNGHWSDYTNAQADLCILFSNNKYIHDSLCV